jgi:hypothetical protein
MAGQISRYKLQTGTKPKRAGFNGKGFGLIIHPCR